MLIIQTGGSIDKDYPRLTKGWAFEIKDPAVERILKRVNLSFNYEIKELLKKDSLDMTDEDRELIAQACLKTKHDKILITHGTDTMIKTAAYLASKIKGKKIVLTGSMKPERFKDNDADFNVGSAIGALDLVGNGVYIAMHGKVLAYNKAVRETSTGKFVKKV